MKRYCRCGRSTGDKAGQCRRQERERKEILARNRGMKPIHNKEEKEDTTIRTRRVTFVETAHTPPPTIPGMVSLGKSGGKTAKKNGASSTKAEGRTGENPQKKAQAHKPQTQARADDPAKAKKQPKAENPRKDEKKSTGKKSVKTENPAKAEKKPKVQNPPKGGDTAKNGKSAQSKKPQWGESAPKGENPAQAPAEAKKKAGKKSRAQKQDNPRSTVREQTAEPGPVTLPMPEEGARPVAVDPTAVAEAVTDSVLETRGAGKKARRSEKSGRDAGKANNGRMIRCTFQYSGKGFGFGIPVEGESFAEDIFLPPDETCGAMTGDTVNVELRGRDERGPDGMVRGIVSHNVCAITGVVALDPNGEPVVLPDGDRYKVTVSIPRKDMENLAASVGTKVAVEPIGDPYFVREDLSCRRPRDHKAAKRTRCESDVRLPEVRGRIVTVFGDAETKGANYAAILHDAGIPTTFPAYVLRAAEESSHEMLTTVGRRDLRSRVIFTIDGAGAKDLDDAISLTLTDDGYILGVHIADVSHYVPYGSCVEKEARERGTSVYFVDKVVPMLPESLSNGACSLNAGEDKYALTCEIALDKNGSRMGGAVYRSLIRSTVRGVYSEVNALLDGTAGVELHEKYAQVMPTLREMHKLYGHLQRQAADRGVLELSDQETEIVLDADGMPIELKRRERGEAEKMIEQFMLCANMTVAELLYDHALPCLYRIHETPDAEKIASFGIFAHNLGLQAGDIVPEAVKKPAALSQSLRRVLREAQERGLGDTVSAVLLRSMMKAKYVAECAPHFGLGAPVYCHFTSPIRRYPDLFVHTVLNAVLPYTPDGILASGTELPGAAIPEVLAAAASERGAFATECEIRAQEAEWRIEDLYIALYMRSHIGEEFDAVVDGVMPFGIFVRCENLAEGLIPAATMDGIQINEAAYTFRYRGAQYTLGTPLRVRLDDADISSGKLTFSVV